MRAFKRVLGMDTLDLSGPLTKASVPHIALDEACKACSIPCDPEDMGEYPSMFIDTSSNMVGRVKPFGRQVIISTGQTNWAKEVTDVDGTLAYYLADHDAHHITSGSGSHRRRRGEEESTTDIPGFISTKDTSRLMILNGSLRSASDDPSLHSVLVLPDYVLVNEVPESKEGASDLWRSQLDASVGRGGRMLKQPEADVDLKTWPIPYDVVIMLCSHKRRDNRCGLTAPILEHAFTTTLSSLSWEVHTELELDTSSPPFQESIPPSATPSDRQTAVEKALREIPEQNDGENEKRALIVKVSHVGGHKLAGNVVLYTPNGTGVWYGRVTPKDVPAIVEQTIVKGKIIPELLRVAINAPTSGGKCMHDW